MNRTQRKTEPTSFSKFWAERQTRIETEIQNQKDQEFKEKVEIAISDTTNTIKQENLELMNKIEKLSQCIEVLSIKKPSRSDFEKWTYDNLVKYCRENKMRGYSKLNKSELIDFIVSY